MRVIELCEPTSHDDPDIVDYITKFNQEQINNDLKSNDENDDNNECDLSNETDENTYEPLLPPLKLDDMDESADNNENDDTDQEYLPSSAQIPRPRRFYRKNKKFHKANNSVFEFKEENKEFPGILCCNKCEYKTIKKYLLSRHVIMHQKERPFKCEYCEKSFKISQHLENHRNKHLGIKKRHCTECETCFTSSSELLRHIRYKHTLERPFRCSICTYSSVEKAKLNRHIRSHTGERPFPCPHCSYRSADMFKLKRHIRVHTGEKPYKCDVCSMCFSQQNSMKSHRNLHFERPVFQCELCPSALTREADLRDHVRRIHTSTAPILCRKCGKSFPDRYTFKIHSKTHRGQMCFKCELCDFQTNYMHRLESHMFNHTGDRPFKCRYCEEDFHNSVRLSSHLVNVHHVNNKKKLILQCNYCSKLFVSHKCFMKHLRKFHPDVLEKEDGNVLEDSVITNNSIVADIIEEKSEKKKRGRPKKLKPNDSVDSSFVADSSLNRSTNRKRGRPRKNPPLLIENIKHLDESIDLIQDEKPIINTLVEELNDI